MAATLRDPRVFFSQGSAAQFDYVMGLYEEAVKLKAEQKNKKPEEFLKLDKWYQHELPKRIKARGKEAHLTHEELCQCMKWKLSRGKFSPRLKDLIQMNTPRLCMSETKKGFRQLHKKGDLSSAVAALCNLKGVGPAMASTILTAGFPDMCGFMADECLLAIPNIDDIDYTVKQLLNYVENLKNLANRLNGEGTSENKWNPHKTEMALWAHFVLGELKKEMLNDMPGGITAHSTENGSTDATQPQTEKNGTSVPEESNDSMDSALANKENLTANSNGTSDVDEDSRASFNIQEDTNDSVPASEPASEATSEVPSDIGENSNLTSTAEEEDLEPAAKRAKVDV